MDLGLVDYGEALAFQRDLREQRLEGRAPDTLVLLEHPPTFTIGRRSDDGEFVTPRPALEAQGFAIHEVERGGRTTYHGPGQLVGYPIVSLRELGLTVPGYVSLLEDCLIGLLGGLGLSAERRPGYPGVWVHGRKVAAVGVHLKRWVSMHGFALNVRPDLSHFAAITPCGITDAEVTSVYLELGEAPPMELVKRRIGDELSARLGYEAMEWSGSPVLSSSP